MAVGLVSEVAVGCCVITGLSSCETGSVLLYRGGAEGFGALGLGTRPSKAMVTLPTGLAPTIMVSFTIASEQNPIEKVICKNRIGTVY